MPKIAFEPYIDDSDYADLGYMNPNKKFPLREERERKRSKKSKRRVDKYEVKYEVEED